MSNYFLGQLKLWMRLLIQWIGVALFHETIIEIKILILYINYDKPEIDVDVFLFSNILKN